VDNSRYHVAMSEHKQLLEKSLTPPSSKVVTMIMACLLMGVAIWVWSSGYEPLPDFATMEVPEKKQAFFDFLRPHITSANQAIAEDRARLKHIAAKLNGAAPTLLERWFLSDLAKAYDLTVDEPPDYASLTQELLQRVDTIPSSLMLVQAAKESAWGTSRFAKQGFNLFGQHCYRTDCGLMPADRAQGRRHEVAVFSSVRASVEAYLQNVNTHHRYQALREQRARLRAATKKLTGVALAEGLLAYSERREAYIKEVKSMIRQNNLE
jgi:Bax protein